MMIAHCQCGSLLHYADPAIQHYVELANTRLGSMLHVSTPSGAWFVPRHYYALHRHAAVPRFAQASIPERFRFRTAHATLRVRRVAGKAS